jgi:hypothetical protein
VDFASGRVTNVCEFQVALLVLLEASRRRFLSLGLVEIIADSDLQLAGEDNGQGAQVSQRAIPRQSRRASRGLRI